MNALEKTLDFATLAAPDAVHKGRKDRLRGFRRTLLHAASLGRQKDTARTAVTDMDLTAHETPHFQQSEYGSHRIRVRGGPFHDGNLRDSWFACHDAQQHKLVGRHAVVQHQGIGAAMK